jgi:hypothetical protein
VRLGKLGVVATVLAAAAAMTTGTAQAAPAACGTSPSHWVGSFVGEHIYEGAPSNGHIDVDISNGPDGLVVNVVSNDWLVFEPRGSRIENGKLIFNVFQNSQYYRGTYYTDTVTCGANGTVSAFSGVEHWQMGIFTGPSGETPYEVARG